MILPILGGIGIFSRCLSAKDTSADLQQEKIRIRHDRKHDRISPETLAQDRLSSGNIQSLADLIREWQAEDPAGFEKWLLQAIPHSDAKAPIVLIALVRADLPRLAIDRIALVQEPYRGSAVESLFASIAATHPIEAWNQAQILGSRELEEIARNIILAKGSDSKLPELADLAFKHSQSPADHSLLGNIVSRWASQDPAAAALWLNGKSLAADIRDQVARQLVFQCDTLNRSPETALAWAECIADAGQRYQAVAAASLELAAEHPELADETIRRSKILSEDEKLSLLANLSAPPCETHFPPPD